MADDISKNLYVQNVDGWKNNLLYKRFSDMELKVNIVERGIILPVRKIDGAWKGGVCDSDLNFVAGFSRRDPHRNLQKNAFACVESSYPVTKEELVELDEDVIFGGTLIGHFGHFMLECWSRLWYVIQHPELQSKIVFIVTPTHGFYHSWYDNFFRLMGLDIKQIVYLKKPTRYRSVTVPDQSQYSPVSYTKEYRIPFDKIKSNITPGAPKKFYLSRKDYEDDGNIGVHCYNEKYFEDFFVARGFEAVSIETLSIEEQISLIMGADEIAATLGTLTHWAIFCKPNTKLIMLDRTDSYVSLLQCLINEISGVEYYIVDASKNFMYANRHIGVCMLGSNKYWKAFVADYFGEQIDEDDDRLYVEDTLKNYVDFWCKKYPPTNNLNLWTDSLKTLCNRIIALEKELHMKRPLLTYQTHVGMKGWQPWKFEDQYSSPLDQQCDIQAINIKFSEPFRDVYYAVYFNDREGWSQEVCNGAQAGTTGKSKSITGIKIRLDDSGGGC